MSDANTAAIEAVAAAINRLAEAVAAFGSAPTGQTAPATAKPAKVTKTSRPVRVSEELSAFTGIPVDEEVTRKEATAKVMQYVHDNGLQDVDDKRNILPDAALATLLGREGVLKCLNLQSSLKHHFTVA